MPSKHLGGTGRIASRGAGMRASEPKRMRGLVKQAQFNAGLEATENVHILGHTFCTRLAMARIAPTVIQALAGHKHLTTTMRYMHVVPGVTAEAIKMLDRPLPTGLAPEDTGGAASGLGRAAQL